MFRRAVRQVATGGAVAFFAMSVVSVSATAQAGSTGRPASCVVPDDAALQAVATETADGYLRHQEWVARPAAQRVVGAVNRAVEETFGHPDRVSAREQLRRGLIGSALDHHTQTVVVVVDPRRVDRNALHGRVLGAVARERAASGGALPSLGVDVRAGCSSAEDLLAAEAVLTGRTWHPGAAKASYLAYLDASDSTYHVSFGEKDRAVAEALSRTLGHRVTVKVASASSSPAPLSGRFDDPPPHWGGANIYIPTGETEACTSGFTVVEKGTNRPGSVTAGHCGGVGRNFFSGTHDFGVVTKSFHDTSRDMAFLTSTAGHQTSYDHFIYTDPGTPAVRNVVGRADPTLNSSVCISGSITGARCSVTVTSLAGGMVCGPFFCTIGLAIGKRAGVIIIEKGDSGAPVYGRTANDGAIIHGMATGANDPATPPADIIGFHRVGQIETTLGVTVSTG